MDATRSVTNEAIRTPRAAGVAGIAFALLLGGALVLTRLAVPSAAESSTTWLTESGKRRAVELALNLVPFAGIAFLWFIGVIRDRIGEREDRFFATVFLGSGLLFVGMLFVGAAIAGGMLADPTIQSGRGARSSTVGFRATDHVRADQRLRDPDGSSLHPFGDHHRAADEDPPPLARRHGLRGGRRALVRREPLGVDQLGHARVGVPVQRRHPGQEPPG